MKVKKYIADDFQTALRQAKQEMGKDAILLNTRQIEKKGLFSLFKKSQVEITVAIDKDVRLERDKMRNLSPQKLNNSDNSNNSAMSEQALLMKEMFNMQELILDIKDKIANKTDFSLLVEKYYQILLKSQVNSQLAQKIARQIEDNLSNEGKNDSLWIKKQFYLSLENLLPEVIPLDKQVPSRAHVVMMVGPTGVGKTTTIAKLAARKSFIESKQVAFITLDTYRVSAAEQLRTYAEIINIPIKVAFNTQQLSAALEEYKNFDFIFIDTAGRSPLNPEQMQELEELTHTAQPDETLLVLSLTMTAEDMINNCISFNPIGIDKFVFTKIDETTRYGNLISLMAKYKRPIAYFTNGQDVPDDIFVPQINSYINKILMEDINDVRSSY